MHVRQAQAQDVDAIAPLFDAYRQFYRQNPAPDLARSYLQDRLAKGESIIFLAEAEDTAVGFTQLYPTFCSVQAAPYFVLYDLFVIPELRGSGVGEQLMNRARDFARAEGAVRLDLETAIDNVRAQGLYEKLGYERDTVFYKYSLALTEDTQA